MTLNNVLAPGQQYNMEQQAINNGNFDRWDRGTSFVNPVSGAITAERYVTAIVLDGGTNPTITHSKLTLTPGDIPKSSNGYRINASAAGSGYGVNSLQWLSQKIELGTSKLCGLGKKNTLTFWLRSDVVGKKFGVYFLQSYGSGGSPSASEVISGTNWTLTSTWTKYTYTFTTNTLVGKSFGSNNDDNLGLNLVYQWGATLGSRVGASSLETFVGSGNIDIAQIQLNGQDVALPFQPKSTSQEELDCQRFCIAYTDANISFPIGDGSAISTTQAKIHVELPRSMRIAPSLTATAADWQLTDGVTATDVTGLSIVSGQLSNKTVTLLVTVASGLTQFRPYQLIADGTANRLMIFECEL